MAKKPTKKATKKTKTSIKKTADGKLVMKLNPIVEGGQQSLEDGQTSLPLAMDETSPSEEVNPKDEQAGSRENAFETINAKVEQGIDDRAGSKIESSQAEGLPLKPDVIGSDMPMSEPNKGFANVAGAFGAGGNLARKSPDDNGSKFIYIGFLVGGFFLILFGKWAFNASAHLLTILAAITIVFYGVYAGFSQRHNKVRIDRIGDNCYYLGLTYTLASLIAALLALGSEVIGRVLLENFGTALISTAVGIIMRLVLMQFRSEIDDAEAEARIQLMDASENFRQQLFSAKADFENFQTAMMMSVQATQNEVATLLKTQAKNLTTAVGGSIQALETRLGGAQQLITSFEGRFDELDAYVSHLGASSKGLAERMDNVHASPKAVEEAFERLSGNLDDTSQKLTSSVQALGARVKESSQIEVSMSGLEGTLMRIEALVSNMETNIEAQARTVTQSKDILETQAEALKNFTDKAKVQGDTMRAATNEVYGAMGDLAKVVIKGVKGG